MIRSERWQLSGNLSCRLAIFRGTALRLADILRMTVLLAGLASLFSCTPKPDGGEISQPERKIGHADLVNLIENHNQRVEHLARTFSNGVIEFRWVDEEGKEHFEPQVNAKLWIELPRRTALRAEKLGEVILWLGSDAEQYWFFDLMSDERVLYSGRHDEPLGVGEESPILIEPLALLDLMGLAPLPDDASSVAVTTDHERDALVIAAQGQGGLMRIFFDQSTRLPVRVETLAMNGEIILQSKLDRYEGAETPGMFLANWPRVPTLIDISDPAGSVAVKLALDQPTSEADESTWDRFFDLTRLTEHLRPDRVERAGPN